MAGWFLRTAPGNMTNVCPVWNFQLQRMYLAFPTAAEKRVEIFAVSFSSRREWAACKRSSITKNSGCFHGWRCCTMLGFTYPELRFSNNEEMPSFKNGEAQDIVISSPWHRDREVRLFRIVNTSKRIITHWHNKISIQANIFTRYASSSLSLPPVNVASISTVPQTGCSPRERYRRLE